MFETIVRGLPRLASNGRGPTNSHFRERAYGYDRDEFFQALMARGVKPRIPPRKGRNNPHAYCKKFYKTRYKVENMFGKLKD